jgi:hypothetical protein
MNQYEFSYQTPHSDTSVFDGGVLEPLRLRPKNKIKKAKTQGPRLFMHHVPKSKRVLFILGLR